MRARKERDQRRANSPSDLFEARRIQPKDGPPSVLLLTLVLDEFIDSLGEPNAAFRGRTAQWDTGIGPSSYIAPHVTSA